jgi:hypothetical protein
MKYSLLALTALLLPPQAMIVQACDTTAQGILFLEPESATFCHPYPACTSWTAKDTAGVADTVKAKIRAQKADSGDVLIGDYDLTNVGEFVRLELKKGQVYRVEFASRSGSLQIQPRRNWEQAALPLTIEDIPRASGTRALEIVPRQDGEYDFRATAISGFGLKLRIFREATPSRRWQRLSGNRA